MSTTCPPIDGTSRSIWSILGSCALTLLICVWHARHPSVPSPHVKKWYHPFTDTMALGFALLAIFLDFEFMAYFVGNRCWRAHRTFRVLRPKFKKLNLKWTMTHAFFAQMGGFYYCDEDGDAKMIDSVELLRLCEKRSIANPVITAKEIQDKSKSDVFGKAILVVQLSWFILQVAARHFRGLAVTLIELDTVCMAVLAVIVLISCCNKPHNAQCVHVFYALKFLERGLSPNAIDLEFKPQSESIIGDYPRYWDDHRDDPLVIELKNAMENDNPGIFCLCVTWFIFGCLHLLAWNYPFLTVREERVWRIASLLLTATPLMITIFQLLIWILRGLFFPAMTPFTMKLWNSPFKYRFTFANTIAVLAIYLGSICRIILIVLMFASLRSVPCTSHVVVPWTAYIPHL